jgi:hypothetical protein
MTHEIHWIKEGRVLYVAYQGHQSPDTLRSCLDDMALYLDMVKAPIVMIISWIEVTSSDRDVLRSQAGHRTYSHPMAARGVLVGFNPLEVMMNETTAMNTRGSKNTQYFPSMEEAMEYLEPMLV